MSSYSEQKLKRAFSKLLAIAVSIIVIAILVLTIFFSIHLLSDSKEPWMFVGAYATYNGGTVSTLASINMTMRMEVVDLNVTHAKLLVYQRVEGSIHNPIAGITPNNSPNEYQETFWLSFSNISSLNIRENPVSTSEEHVFIDGFGTRNCVIKEYDQSVNTSEDTQATLTVYTDKKTGWLLKMKWVHFEETLGLNGLELNIKETNIPNL